jgi:PhnB protein
MTAINPYLHFNGKAEEAFNFYKSVFGGEFAALMRFGEMPGCDEMPIPEAEKDKIMHMALPLGASGSVLMGGDTPERMGQLTFGNNFTIAISPVSRDEADRIFNGLAEGGIVEMPLADAFWGGYFGGLKDKFGVSWMVNYDEQNKQ